MQIDPKYVPNESFALHSAAARVETNAGVAALEEYGCCIIRVMKLLQISAQTAPH